MGQVVYFDTASMWLNELLKPSVIPLGKVPVVQTDLDSGVYVARLSLGIHQVWGTLDIYGDDEDGRKAYVQLFQQSAHDAVSDKTGQTFIDTQTLQQITDCIAVPEFEQVFEPLNQYPDFMSHAKRFHCMLDMFRLLRGLRQHEIQPHDRLGFRRVLEQSMDFKQKLIAIRQTSETWKASLTSSPLIDFV